MPTLDYDLHKLGWRAFQDLCAVILQQVLGQTFHTFADSNDAGRDGAFYGHWTIGSASGLAAIGPDAAVVAQCKFSVQDASTLTPSMVANEIGKIARFKERGLCDSYLLMTNLAVTGRTDEWLREQLGSFGVDKVLILDGRWICQQISQRADLRRYVPRVYGLGDLGKILDDRRLRQAQLLLGRLQADLATFVPTEAYRRAADAVADHGFALLLGEPACGKSTIAATLAMAALDNWDCGVRRVDSADELVAAWDPDDQRQLFWVDDAFGGIRHDASLTDAWSRRMDQVMTAVSHGVRVVLTSRDYIYREARPYLKEYAYPRLREHQVVIDVTDLTEAEKRQILYNHLRAGDQPREVLESWRPFLREVAAEKRFQPEVARRLAWQAFTRRSASPFTGSDLVRYMERPIPFLTDVIRQLDVASRAALACVYVSGNELVAPVQFAPPLTHAVNRLGSTEQDVLQAFPALDGTFLQCAADTNGDPIWRFRHPTIREGFAAVVAEDVNAISILVDGLNDEELLRQVDCGGADSRGTLVRVPASLYGRIVSRVKISEREGGPAHPLGAFLAYRCSPAFLRAWASHHLQDLGLLLRFGNYVDAHWQPSVLGRLHEAGALPESTRQLATERIEELSLSMLDSGWLGEPISHLFTDSEREHLLQRIRNEILPNLEDEIDWSADGYVDDIEPSSRYQTAREAVATYRRAFSDNPQVMTLLENGERYIEGCLESAESDYDPAASSRLTEPSLSRTTSQGDRDEFDDIADDR